jgi:hypothetical protein
MRKMCEKQLENEQNNRKKVGNKMVYNKKEMTVSDALVFGIKTLVRRRATPWVGTMTQLNEVLQNRLHTLPENWPGSASALRVALNKAVNRIRNAGVSVRFSRSKTRLVEFRVR